MSKFVVVKIGYAYNDEYYSRGNFEGGIPDKIFDSRDEADRYCERLNLDSYQGFTPGEYGVSHDFLEHIEYLLQIGAITEDPRDNNEPKSTRDYWSYDTSLNNDLGDEILRQVRDLFGLRFYEVYKVD
jgi:hypothetical protein